MRNAECIIYISNKNGWLQKYHQEKGGWKQTSRNGTVRPVTAEQLLSHLLPPLVKGSRIIVRVEKKIIASEERRRKRRRKAGKEAGK